MKLIVKIAGLNKDDPRYRLMLDKKAELQEFCDEYESILKEPLPQYAIDGVLPQSRSSRPGDKYRYIIPKIGYIYIKEIKSWLTF